MTGPSYWLSQHLLDVSHQAVVSRDADRILHAPFLQQLVDLWLRKGGIGSKHDFFAQLLLPLDLRQQQLFPIFSAVDASRSNPHEY